MRSRIDGRVWPIVLAALRVGAEAGWITVVYAAAAVVMSHGVPVLGPIEFSVLVLAGVVVGRISRSRPDLGAVLLIAGVVAGGALAWAASPEARELLPNLPRALGIHLAGWLGGIAVLRGAIASTGPRAATEIEGLMRIVPPALGLVWAYTTFAVRPDLWLPFAVSAMWGTVLFLSAALVAIGMARLNVLHSEVSDVRQKRAWRWLVAGVGFGIVPVAVPVAILSGIPLSALMTPVVGPIQWVIGLVAIPLSWMVWILTEILRPLSPGFGEFLDRIREALESRQRAEPNEATGLGTVLGLLLLVFTIAVVGLSIFYFARWLLTRRQLTTTEETGSGAGSIEREIILPARAKKPAAPPRTARRRGSPRDAVTVYLGALAELVPYPEYARAPTETPAQHAARVKSARMPAATDLARLAAAYQLARYADRRISPPENVRAVGRLQRLRRLLRASSP